MSNKKTPAIGIDLGTTYSCVGVFLDGHVEIIANDQGNRTTPSIVAFCQSDILIGDAAKSQIALNPENVVFDAKRLIGRKYSDPTVQSDKEYWPFTVIEEADKAKICVKFKNERRLFSPEEISAMVLTKMKETAETFLGQTVTNAAITVPAYFNDSQRQATKDAATIAGLSVLRIINEPTAAAIAYGLDKHLEDDKIILIFDLGGGTFDVSLLTIEEGHFFRVLSTSGNTHLGGEDFDSRLLTYFIEEFKSKFSKDLRVNPKSVRRLRTACEGAKKILSSSSEANIELNALFEGHDFHSRISRARFEELCLDLFSITLQPLKKALKDAKLKKSVIHDIVLVGGSTRIPKIQKLLKDFFNGKDLCMSINPDEAVAYGAAVQAAVLSWDDSKNIRDLLLVDVVPLSLGVCIRGTIMCKIIERNTAMPCKLSKILTTYYDNQTAINFEIYEGERAMIENNHLLGKFRFEGIPPAPKGTPNIIMTFDIDANGILHVSAKDESSGNIQGIKITHEERSLSKDEIERVLREAKEHETEDQMIMESIQMERIQARSSLEQYVCSAKEAIESCPDSKLPPDDKSRAISLCEEIIQWLENNASASTDEIERKKVEAERQLSPIMKKLHGKSVHEPCRINECWDLMVMNILADIKSSKKR